MRQNLPDLDEDHHQVRKAVKVHQEELDVVLLHLARVDERDRLTPREVHLPVQDVEVHRQVLEVVHLATLVLMMTKKIILKKNENAPSI